MTDSQLTGTIQLKEKGVNKQVLDKLKVERERGITGPVLYIAIGQSLILASSESADC